LLYHFNTGLGKAGKFMH